MHAWQKLRAFPKKVTILFHTRLSSIQIIVLYYLFITFISFILLSLPFFHKSNVQPSFMDLLFMTISTVSVTGLTTFNINEVFNHYGIILLEILFQIGGLGIMMISTLFFLLSRKKISLRQRQLIMTDMNQPKLSGTVRLIRTTLFIMIGLQLLFGVFFSVYFYFSHQFQTVSDSLFYGFYQSISSVTNSGFDVTGDSIMPFRLNSLFLLVIMFLIFIGGIGFPVILEVREWLHYKLHPTRLPFRFSLFSKLAISSFFILFIGGALFIYLLEGQRLFSSLTFGQKIVHSMFYSITTRNAGLQLDDLNQFQPATLLLFSILMFIGCSPSSVGGGVRTTTMIILGLYLVSFIKSEDNVRIFGRRIDEDDIKKSVVVFLLSLLMCGFSIMILSVTESHSLLSIIFEVSSAFGTTGLSLGITSDLTIVGKIVIALLMFIGRIGMLYTLMLFIPKERKDMGYVYPSEKIIIG